MAINNAKIKLALNFLVPLMFLFIPMEMKLKLFFIITIWGVMAIALDTMDKLIPSIAMPSLYILLGIAPASVVYSPWAQSTISLTISSLITAGCLGSCGLLTRLSAIMLKHCGGKFTRVCWGVFLVSLVLNMATFAGCIIFIAALITGMVKSLNLQRTKEGMLLFMGSFWAGCSVQTFMYQPMSVPIVAAAAGGALNTTFNITWLDFLHAQWPLIIVTFIVQILAMLVFGANKSTVNMDPVYFENMLKKLGPMSKREKWALFLLIVMTLYILTAPIHGLETSYGFISFIVFALLPGINVCTSEDLKNADWSIMFFVAAFLGIGAVAGTVGVSELFATAAGNLVAAVGTKSALGLMSAFGTIANFILTPIAILTTFGGPMAILAVENGFSPMASMFVLVMTEWLIVLPYESMPSVVCYSFGAVSMKQFVVFSLMRLAVFFVGFFFLLLPWWGMIGLI